MTRVRGRLAVVGVGPGDGYVTGPGERLARSSAVFVGGAAALQVAPAWGRRVPIEGDLSVVLTHIEEALISGEDVCVLTSGDPGYFGMLAALERRFPGEAVVEPSVSSMQLLAARVGVPWQELRHVSVHGRRIDTLARAETEDPLAVLCGGENTPSAVAARLLEHGASAVAAVGVALGRPDESVTVTDLQTVAGTDFGTPAVMIVASRAWLEERGYRMAVRRPAGEKADLSLRLEPTFVGAALTLPVGRDALPVSAAPGIPDGEFERIEGVPLSRWEVRAVLASIARPRDRRVIWDIGAGSGGFAVEMALLAPNSRVVAFERSTQGCEAVRRNAERFGARVEVREGEVPGVLEGLAGEESPDLVVVGGSGGRLEEIIELTARWLAPGGRLIVTAVTLETAGLAARMLAWEPWVRHDALQLATARLDRAGIMKGANPTTIVWADKESS
jgi:precorrin-6Y C5,15-methyltransferase (decarboxylating)